jgi:hypothetical protein
MIGNDKKIIQIEDVWISNGYSHIIQEFPEEESL